MQDHEQKSVKERLETLHNIIDNEEEYYTTIRSTAVLNYKDIHTQVEEKTFNEFKNIVLLKHGKLHSAIGKELTKAMQMYNELQSIKLQHKTYSSTKSWKLREDVALKFDLIKKKLYSLHSYPEIHTKSIEQIVREVLGKVDYRTFNKYYKMIVQSCVIINTGIHGSVLDVQDFVGYKKIEIDTATLAPTKEEDEKLV